MLQQILRVGCVLAFCIVGSNGTAAANSSSKLPDSPVVIPQANHDADTSRTDKANSRFGFGFGAIEGDASGGRTAFILSTMFAQPLSRHTGLEFSLHHQSTMLSMTGQAALRGFSFIATTWSGDFCAYTSPLPGWRQLRIVGGLSLRNQISANTYILSYPNPATGQIENDRAYSHQQALSIGATLKADLALWTFARSEITLRGQAYIYGAPFVGDNPATPRGAAGGGASIQILIQAYF
jgi:hypothetical protein